MNQKYTNLLSPVRVGNRVLKNRMLSANSMPHFLQGPEPYPSMAVIEHFASRAKNGAAIVTCTGITNQLGLENPPPPPDAQDTLHFPVFDMRDPKCQNYLIQLADAIHYYGSVAAMNFQFPILPGYGVVAEPERGVEEMNQEIIDQCIDSYVEQAILVKKLGFDMGSIQFSYGLPFLGQFISPRFNQRTDEYGGSIQNRGKVILEVFRRIKQAVGRNFLMEGIMTAEDCDGGHTLDDTIAFVKMAEGLIDILQLRMSNGDDSHPTGFLAEPTPTVKYSEAIMPHRPENMLIAPIGGLHDPDMADRIIAEGKADLIATARTWICEPDYGAKLYKGTEKDIVPCIRCNKCHVISQYAPFRSACSVNPKFGLPSVINTLLVPADLPKRIAIIGGGPAGMESAIHAAIRGHDVTLYEQSQILGGQLNYAAIPSFKWPIRSFIDYLKGQLKKSNVMVRMNTKATPKLLREEKYDVIFAAVGSMPITPPISGLDNVHFFTAVEALSQPEHIIGSVAVIGGGEIGIETAMFLAERGHVVNVYEMTRQIAKEAMRPHYFEILEKALKKFENLHIHTESKVLSLKEGKMLIETPLGHDDFSLPETIVIAAGYLPKSDEALSFYGVADEFFMLGDCNGESSLMGAMRSGYAAATRI